jgi:hypothetical protein
MTIARYENFTINNLTFGTDSFGDYTTTITKWFDTRGRVKDVRNGVQITKDERVYTDLTTFTVNYTPNTRRIVDYQNLYSITWRGNDWRITDCLETNDRMNVIFMCYRNDPTTPV